MRISLRATCLFLAVLPFGACQCQDEVVVIKRHLIGVVCDPDTHEPLPGTRVVATPADEKAETVEADADATGNVDLLVVAGAYALTIGARTTPLNVDVLGTEERTLFDDPACFAPPDPPTTCDVEGHICNRHTGEVVQSGDVTVLLPSGELAATQTDDSGGFTLEGLPPGEHTLTVRGVGFSRSFLVECVAGEVATLNYGDGCYPAAFNEGNIQGHFCDPETLGHLVGADVTATNQDTGDVHSDVTDLDGNFYLNALPLGTYDMSVVRTGQISLSLPSVTVTAGVTLTVQDPSECADQPSFGAVEGQLCADDGGVFFQGDVTVSQLGAEVDRTTTGSDGRWRIDHLPPGSYLVTMVGSTRSPWPVDIVANQTQYFEEDLSTCITPPQEQCADQSVSPTEIADGRIMLVVDRSGSMSNNVSGSNQSKWSAMRNALTNVTSTLSGTVEFGLVLYPSPQSGNACATGTEEVPLGPATAQMIATEMQNADADGNTPTATSLQVAKQLVEPLLSDGRPISVLLATDGAPNCRAGCNYFAGECWDTNNTIAGVQALRDIGVLTYVVGVQSNSTFSDVLNQLALTGGTALPGAIQFYDAVDEASITTAISAIVQRIASCRVDLDQSLYSASQVSVMVGTQPIARDPTRTNGWDIVGTYSIELYGDACELITDPNATMESSTVHVHRCELQ